MRRVATSLMGQKPTGKEADVVALWRFTDKSLMTLAVGDPMQPGGTSAYSLPQ